MFGIERDVYERLAVVPGVTVAAVPVLKLPFVIVKTPFETAADAPEAEVTTVAGVTAVGVLVVHAVISSAEIAAPVDAEPIDTVEADTDVIVSVNFGFTPTVEPLIVVICESFIYTLPMKRLTPLTIKSFKLAIYLISHLLSFRKKNLKK